MEARPIEADWLPLEGSKRIQASIIARLAEATGLKPLPVAVQKALSVLRGTDFSAEDVARLFSGDPALAASVLRLANSPLFRGAATIDRVEQAVVRLGAITVEELLVTAASSGLFNDATGAGTFYRDHCAGTASVARVVADRLRPDLRERMFLCGLMHDMGKLVLLQGGEDFYKKTLDATSLRAPDRIHVEEFAHLGYDHALLGAYVLHQWNIPAPLPKVIALHHRPPEDWPVGRVGATVALLRIADRIEPTVANRRPDLYRDHLIDLEDSPEVSAAGLDVGSLGDMFDHLVEARRETLDLITSIG